MIGFSSKLAVVSMSSLVLLSAIFLDKHDKFISICMSIGMLSFLSLVLYLKWWLQCFYKLSERILDKASFIEARLDAQAPAPSDILRHLTEWFQVLDSRGGSDPAISEIIFIIMWLLLFYSSFCSDRSVRGTP